MVLYETFASKEIIKVIKYDMQISYKFILPRNLYCNRQSNFEYIVQILYTPSSVDNDTFKIRMEKNNPKKDKIMSVLNNRKLGTLVLKLNIIAIMHTVDAKYLTIRILFLCLCS